MWKDKSHQKTCLEGIALKYGKDSTVWCNEVVFEQISKVYVKKKKT